MRRGWTAGAAALLSLAVQARADAPPLPERWPRAPLLELARSQVRAEVAFERYGLTGAGATLCLVDTGVDEALAPDRVRWVWDPVGMARGGALEPDFGGAVYGPGAAPSSPGDPHGHGSAMASIAIGPTGLAPGAGVISVSAWSATAAGFLDDTVVAAVRFCRAVAAIDEAVDERALVVLLSLGGHDGDHRGDGAFERALVRAAGPVPVVVAAGNDGRRAVHAAGRLFDAERARVAVSVPRPRTEAASLRLTVRLGGGGHARLIAPGGASATLRLGEIDLAGTEVDVRPRGDAWTVTLRAGSAGLPAGRWTLEIEGRSRFDVWLAGAQLGETFFPASLGGPHVLEDETITIPATAPELISVGASVARRSIGALADLGAPGEVAGFSSRGPTPSGVAKPDLVAPGGWILVPLSGDTRRADPDNVIGGREDRVIDGQIAVRGSSAAAAVVAGALLLALELNPARGVDARARLIASLDGRGWDPARGFGALDVGRLLDRWGDAPTPHWELVTTRAVIEHGEPLWLVARGAGERLTLRWAGGSLEAPLPGGVAWVRIEPPRVDVLHFEGRIDGRPLPPVEVSQVPDRRRPTTIAGGCQASRRGRATPGWAFIGVVLLSMRIWHRTCNWLTA